MCFVSQQFSVYTLFVSKWLMMHVAGLMSKLPGSWGQTAAVCLLGTDPCGEVSLIITCWSWTFMQNNVWYLEQKPRDSLEERKRIYLKQYGLYLMWGQASLKKSWYSYEHCVNTSST